MTWQRNQNYNSLGPNNQNGMFENDRIDRKTYNKSITFLLVWLRIYPEYHQIQVKN